MILIGHAGHPEVEGTLGQWRAGAGAGEIHLVETLADAKLLQVGQPQDLAYTTQTTLSVDETREIIALLRERYPQMQGPRHDDICYATQNRQHAADREAGVDVVGVAQGQRASVLDDGASFFAIKQENDRVTLVLIHHAEAHRPRAGDHRALDAKGRARRKSWAKQLNVGRETFSCSGPWNREQKEQG